MAPTMNRPRFASRRAVRRSRGRWPVSRMRSRQTATVNQPMPLELFVEDDGHYSNGTNALPTRTPTLIEAVVEKYRGPGYVWVDGFNYFTTTKGGKILEPYAGKAEGTVTFYTPGDYIVHVTIQDTTGKGGGASGCCWTTSMVKVNVK